MADGFAPQDIVSEADVIPAVSESSYTPEDNQLPPEKEVKAVKTPRPPTTDTSKEDKKNEEPETEKGTRLTLVKFTLYETKARFYIIGADQEERHFRVLKIDRTSQTELVVIEDEVIYSAGQIAELLEMIAYGNPGGVRKVVTAFGIVGFIRFTEGYYISLITRRNPVALLGGHYIYHIDDTTLLNIGPPTRVEKNSYINTFQNVDLTRNFYFSYTYDLTHTLQVNMTRSHLDTGKKDTSDSIPVQSDEGEEKQKTTSTKPFIRHGDPLYFNEMFVWNHFLLKNGFAKIWRGSDWILPIINGFVDQAKISVFGRNIFLTLIARRSRYFAGARFLKRGANDQGYVANDVESEQIVAELSTTSFHTQGHLFGNQRYTSYVQHRGSIPLYWSQETMNMSPKPPIELNVVDPFFSAAALHFDDMFKRYGTPVIVLNLIKQKEKAKRETILGQEFSQAINYLNQFLPENGKIQYIAWDMSRASKSRDQDVIKYLENTAQRALASTSFFHSGSGPQSQQSIPKIGKERRIRGMSIQEGIVRTNCIDCLDRTNAAQFVIGKTALGHQLYALGIIPEPSVSFDSDVVNILTEMYHDHGDTIALQYGGSFLVNRMETYRKIKQWTSHSRDMIETIRRYYSNSFVDAEKQDAINLFLGNYTVENGQPMLWELTTDFHLHNQHPWQRHRRRSYQQWWTTDISEDSNDERVDSDKAEITQDTINAQVALTKQDVEEEAKLARALFEKFWNEYYTPKVFSSFSRLFAYHMNGTMKYWPSPFIVRLHQHQQPSLKALESLPEDEDLEESEKDPGNKYLKRLSITQTDDENEDQDQDKIRYLDRYNNVRFSAPLPSDVTPTYDGAYLPYVQSVNGQGPYNPSLFTPILEVDERLFSAYVSIPARALRDRISREDGIYTNSQPMRNRFHGYATYLETGVFPTKDEKKFNNA
ncbi:hypothetical protein BZG36_01584 [Bifiguratus adelaidae]|uniref:SAC domain-containing protein n=1 Tax=Bifiguratus adelaidae TaxID=1938954 RepID=A0A261Y3V1_9FUNG|nr:hypothetical protein BZG36_01584 [Bifiguratus adelaidae]